MLFPGLAAQASAAVAGSLAAEASAVAVDQASTSIAAQP
jgi:hypothetical protein